MQIKSALFVSALMRKETTSGGFATIIHKGAEDAGAIFAIHRKTQNPPQGQLDFYGPAPQIAFDDEPGERLFELLGEKLSDEALEEKLAAQLRFDPDCWVVEIESDQDGIALPLASL